MLDTVLELLGDFHENAEYPLMCSRIQAEIDAILSRAQTYYVNVLDVDDVLMLARAKPLSVDTAKVVGEILGLLVKLPTDELIMVRGLLV